jgi:predicted histidine transporter YuiF (NhaC family)
MDKNAKIVIASYALIGAAVGLSISYSKLLEIDALRLTKRIEKDREQMNQALRNLGK